MYAGMIMGKKILKTEKLRVTLRPRSTLKIFLSLVQAAPRVNNIQNAMVLRVISLVKYLND